MKRRCVAVTVAVAVARGEFFPSQLQNARIPHLLIEIISRRGEIFISENLAAARARTRFAACKASALATWSSYIIILS